MARAAAISLSAFSKRLLKVAFCGSAPVYVASLFYSDIASRGAYECFPQFVPTSVPYDRCRFDGGFYAGGPGNCLGFDESIRLARMVRPGGIG